MPAHALTGTPARFIIGERFRHRETQAIMDVTGPLDDDGHEAIVKITPVGGAPERRVVKRGSMDGWLLIKNAGEP